MQETGIETLRSAPDLRIRAHDQAADIQGSLARFPGNSTILRPPVFRTETCRSAPDLRRRSAKRKPAQAADPDRSSWRPRLKENRWCRCRVQPFSLLNHPSKSGLHLQLDKQNAFVHSLYAFLGTRAPPLAVNRSRKKSKISANSAPDGFLRRISRPAILCHGGGPQRRPWVIET
jgi:hypothetical protein